MPLETDHGEVKEDGKLNSGHWSLCGVSEHLVGRTVIPFQLFRETIIDWMTDLR